jgi:FkbM family methyltransferase
MTDGSTAGCINEIVNNDEYKLSLFCSMNYESFIDIGSNCGVVTIILAKQNPNSVIYSIEPDPELFKILLMNVQLNNLTNVKLFNKACTNNIDKKTTLFKTPGFTGGNTICSENKNISNFYNVESVESVEVECISLDNFIDDNNIKNIKLLKIDCEGAEYDILYESKYFKLGIVENMVGEFHDLQYNIKSKNDINELINYSKQYVDGIFKITILKL